MVRQPYTIHFASKSFGGCPLVTYQSNTSVLVCQIWIPPEKVCDSRCLFRWFYLRYLIIIIFRLEMLALPIKLLLTPTCWSDCRSNSFDKTVCGIVVGLTHKLSMLKKEAYIVCSNLTTVSFSCCFVSFDLNKAAPVQ